MSLFDEESPPLSIALQTGVQSAEAGSAATTERRVHQSSRERDAGSQDYFIKIKDDT